MRPANRKYIGIAYGTITSALVAAIFASGWCWGSENRAATINTPVRDACLAIWGGAGVLLALSQVVFIIVALRMKDGATAKTANVPPETPAGEARASALKVVILILGGGILLVLAFFVFLLSQMPS